MGHRMEKSERIERLRRIKIGYDLFGFVDNIELNQLL